MNIGLRITRWVLAFFISTALGFWIFFATLNATLANRDVVKGWLATSGAYNNALTSFIGVSTDSTQTAVQQSAQEAFGTTFDSAYVRQGTETVIDASYDWMEGKASAITFTIPVNEKSDEFYRNLTAALTPKLQSLPQCTSRSAILSDSLSCVPPGIDPATYAAQLTRPSANDTTLKEPITEKSFGDILHMPWLPAATQAVRTGVWLLPLLILVFSALYVLASPDRLRGATHVARRLTVGAAITLIGGAFLWFASTSIDLTSAVDASEPAQTSQQQAIVTNIMNPLARTVVPSVGQALTLYSGIVVVVAGATWLGAFIWRRRRGSGMQLPPANPHMPPHTPQKEESQLPPPIAKL